MTSFVVAYLVGTVLGELALAAWWMQAQDAATPWSAYLKAKKGEAVLSAAVALVACLAWADGSLGRFTGWDLELTLGLSVVAGAVLAFFAHGAIELVRGRLFGSHPEVKP